MAASSLILGQRLIFQPYNFEPNTNRLIRAGLIFFIIFYVENSK